MQTKEGKRQKNQLSKLAIISDLKCSASKDNENNYDKGNNLRGLNSSNQNNYDNRMLSSDGNGQNHLFIHTDQYFKIFQKNVQRYGRPPCSLLIVGTSPAKLQSPINLRD